MHARKILIRSTVALALVAAPLSPALAQTSGTAKGPSFQRNISGTGSRASASAKIDGFQVYVPARRADGTPAEVGYTTANGHPAVRSETKPLISVYTDDDADPAKGDDVWAAYSRDDGTTWTRQNLSNVAGQSSFTLGAGTSAERPSMGAVSKPVLNLKGNRVLVAWTSSYCDGGDPAYAAMTGPDTWSVGGSQRSVDYTADGFPQVGEVPYKCVWAIRGALDPATGTLGWQQPERLTSGTRYAMQLMANSAPGAGFALAWGEDPDGLKPGNASGPGEGWTGASPHDGTDVWYSFIKMGQFDDPTKKFSVPVPVSDNGAFTASDPAPKAGATRPALMMSPYTLTKPDGTKANSAWVAYGYEETKGLGEDGESGGEVTARAVEPTATEGSGSGTPGAVGKNVIHHAFAFDKPDVHQSGSVMNPQMTDSAGKPMFVTDADGNRVPARENARRVRYIMQPADAMGPSRTIGVLIYRMGVYGEAAAADFVMQRIVVPAGSTGDPLVAANIGPAINVSATTPTASAVVGGVRRVTEWKQTAADLRDSTSASPLESARAHRGFIKGDFLALGYLWSPNWKMAMQGKDVENYYVRRSFDGGATFTTTPAGAPYNGQGVRSCSSFYDQVTGAQRPPVCRWIGPGAFEPAQNLSRLGSFDQTAIEPRLQGLPGSVTGSPYAEDGQDTSVVWQAWGTGLPQQGAGEDPGEEPPDVPVPDEGSGKRPLDLYYTFSQDYGDTYVRTATLAGGDTSQAESQMRFTPDGSRMYAVWNDYGPGDQDVMFRRLTPDVLNTPGSFVLSAARFAGEEGDGITVTVQRVDGRIGEVSVGYRTADGSARAGHDYTSVSGRLTFGHKDMRAQTFTVPTRENRADAPAKKLLVELTGPAGGAGLGGQAWATVVIRDDDDHVAPRSRATAPTVTNRIVVPVRYAAFDRESRLRKVVLYVSTPGSATYHRVAVDRPVDGRMEYIDNGVNGLYRFFTVAVDARGNREARPRVPDSVMRLDTVAPRVSGAFVTPERWDNDSADPVRMGATVHQRARVQFVVKDADGTVVRTFAPVRTGPGQVTRRWFGRTDSGRLVGAGTYAVVARALDRAGNVGRAHVSLVVLR